MKSVLPFIHRKCIFICGMSGTYCILPMHLEFLCSNPMRLGFCSNIIVFTSLNSFSFSFPFHGNVGNCLLYIKSCLKAIQPYCSELPFPSLGDLPDPGIEPTYPTLAGRFFTTESYGKPQNKLKKF